ncbi:hypothetical protein R5R35_012448 [Gryllus longicercus]|uniref:Uncharacterized protein n=1 Tax=Gryllus longicercus TaxID=2509291 RepID=A0AAN9VMV6_9ORTH
MGEPTSPSSGSSRAAPLRLRFARGALSCCTHCGYPQRSLCCFGCSYSTRAIFIGSGGVMAGLTYFLILLFLLICPGKDYIQGNVYVTGFLVLGIIYLPMGLTLIYSAQKRNPHVLLPWIVLNFFFALCEFLGVILAPAYAAKDDALCGKTRVALAVFVLQVIIVGCRCYCIAIVTQFRHKMLAVEAAARMSEPGRTYVF